MGKKFYQIQKTGNSGKEKLPLSRKKLQGGTAICSDQLEVSGVRQDKNMQWKKARDK